MLVTLNKLQNIDNILHMRAQHKRHYITLIKRNKPYIHADVEAFNTQFCNISSNSQKYYNYCFNITCLPTCSITGKILEFRSDKWHYRKYGERGVMSRDSILERSKKHVGIRIQRILSSPVMYYTLNGNMTGRHK